jgi:hypothetical protein
MHFTLGGLEKTKGFLIGGSEGRYGNVIIINHQSYMGPVCDTKWESKEVNKKINKLLTFSVLTSFKLCIGISCV